ncbi:metal-dependent hydrolase [Ruegeria conchae]|uniref:LexA-binding, inner membrane-associated putative hydrolase n=1 Tax=Ruegeria conchae TaxID=981384 RepID=A0A497ZM18_9RHOB|nr:metal-dependent hydrolase [Ruegeria conchae]RLK08103.1 LexA-binding, inner membrane-associated putative hydrolase [Ruegeria conchae]
MFIGHLPGAYLVFRTAAPNLGKLAFTAAMLGAVAPDIDMLWFYLVDDRGHHHHSYLTHRPVIWAGILLAGIMIRIWASRTGTILTFFGAGGLVHMLLDSITGEVAWFWPFSDATHPLVIVLATHLHWILSFLNHWTFKVEILITVIALIVFVVTWRRSKRSP